MQILGNWAKIPQDEMTKFTLIHVGCRLAYNFLYVTTRRRSLSYLRTIVFQFSIYPSIAIFFKAASIL